MITIREEKKIIVEFLDNDNIDEDYIYCTAFSNTFIVNNYLEVLIGEKYPNFEIIECEKLKYYSYKITLLEKV